MSDFGASMKPDERTVYVVVSDHADSVADVCRKVYRDELYFTLSSADRARRCPSLESASVYEVTVRKVSP